jgi:hypothetical protein
VQGQRQRGTATERWTQGAPRAHASTKAVPSAAVALRGSRPPFSTLPLVPSHLCPCCVPPPFCLCALLLLLLRCAVLRHSCLCCAARRKTDARPTAAQQTGQDRTGQDRTQGKRSTGGMGADGEESGGQNSLAVCLLPPVLSALPSPRLLGPSQRPALRISRIAHWLRMDRSRPEH